MREDVEAATLVTKETRPDARDFEAFFEAHHARLFGTLCLATSNAAEAEELMQEAFLKMWENWDRVKGHANPPGYLYRTAFNLHRNRLRKALRARRRIVPPARSEDPLASIEHREALVGGLRRLTPRQRAAIVLIELLDMTSEEAADVLGIRPGTVRALASQGRATLRATLEEVSE